MKTSSHFSDKISQLLALKTRLTHYSHAQTVGESAPLLRDVILEQLHDLKEEEYVTTTAQQDDSDSDGTQDKDAVEGTDLDVLPPRGWSGENGFYRWYLPGNHTDAHAHSHARTFFEPWLL